jgi:hypothetical protein
LVTAKWKSETLERRETVEENADVAVAVAEKRESHQAVRSPPEEPTAGAAKKAFRLLGRKDR